MKRVWTGAAIAAAVALIAIAVIIVPSTSVKALPQFDLIDTYAGNGDAGFVGDGLNAFLATFHNPTGIAADMIGNVYIADMQNNRIRKIDPSMVLTTIAGSGDFGFAGDEYPALEASFAFPAGVDVYTVNQRTKYVNVYIADTRNNRIRRINRYGVITTIAGDGKFLYSGDRGPAVKASLAWPTSICVDVFENIYVADSANNCVRVVVNQRNQGGETGAARVAGITNGQEYCRANYIYRLAGTTVRGYSASGVDVNNPSYQTRRVKAMDVNLNTPFDVSVVWPGIESARSANLDNYDKERVYFSDTGNHVIRFVNHSGDVIPVAGVAGVPGYSGDIYAATNEKLNMPLGIWVDPDDQFLYLCDSANRRVRVISVSHTEGQLQSRIKTLVGNGFNGFSGDGSDAKVSRISRPQDICGDPLSFDIKPDDANTYAANFIRKQPTLFFTDMINQRIRSVELMGFSGPEGTLRNPNAPAHTFWGGFHSLDQEVWGGRYWEDNKPVQLPSDWSWDSF